MPKAAEESGMSVEYLLVTFDQVRRVLADGDAVGVTNHILMIPAGEYEITLEGANYAPASQDVTIAGTSIMRPKVLPFT